jgi:hypothetical protein
VIILICCALITWLMIMEVSHCYGTVPAEDHVLLQPQVLQLAASLLHLAPDSSIQCAAQSALCRHILSLPCPCVTCQVPYNDAAMNCVWGGLWMGITYTAILLVALVYTVEGRGTAAEQSLHASQMTWVSLPCWCCVSVGGISISMALCSCWCAVIVVYPPEHVCSVPLYCSLVQ